ncbi:MAG TPA: ABC transporter ATP-binding protein [Candidatus Avacidaminococcus intestinavium]|uniref:ABC transporter ATP-binding protein n=1 Tax=Candidatus Avacidaminococcus intestinavium TaxID=2840684 RepID=A0A9D1MRD5_9FIRM|nr:ABC transporter ATP-binding protein [Candidatus Avacidaminococcus intestinavium]
MDTVINVQNIDTGYGEKIILNGLSFTIEKGEMIGIVGPNGAGKSTLLKTLRGLLPHKQGTISICNKQIETIKERDFAHLVAYLQQHVDVSFGYTGKELVLAGRYPYLKWWQGESLEDEVIAKQCMEYTGVWDLAERPVQELSGGQKQRILLAKVLAQKTPILFLDEPTTGLDIVYQEEIFRFCSALCRAGKTVIMVAHELNLAAKFCTRLLLVAKGGILADGHCKEVLTSTNLTTAYGVPVSVVANPISNSLDISIIPSEEDEARKEYLVKAICDLL